jgi:cell division protein ZapA
MANDPVKINILDREFLIACPEEEKPALMQSAGYLHKKMQEIRDSGKVIGIDRIAVMAALNITHELLQSKSDSSGLDEIRARLQALNDKLAAAG